jgi:hypothetical protein
MATFSPAWRDQLTNRMTSLRISQATVAAITGLPQNKLCAFFSGSRGLENQDLTKIYDLLVSCETIAALVAPVPVDWRETIALKASFEAFKNGELRSVSAGTTNATA